MKTYSILIPHRNAFNLLHRAVKSIPVREDIEILIIDNSTEEIDFTEIKQLNKSIRVLYSEPARGAGGARNVGMEKSSGKWLLFLDADDFFMPTAFHSFDQFATSSDDIIFFKWASCYSDTLKPANRHFFYNRFIDLYFHQPDTNEFLLRYKLDTPCAKMVLSDLVKKYHLEFDECVACNDAFFSAKTGFYAEKVTASKEVVYCATVNKGSITNTRSKRNFESRYLANLRINRFLREKKLYMAQRPIVKYLLQAFRYGPHTGLTYVYWAIKYHNNLFFGAFDWIGNIKYRKKAAINESYIVK